MELSDVARRWSGLEPTHTAATAVAAVAARMEHQAASTHPDEHPRWKAILYRSADWLCLRGTETDPSLLDLASDCLQQARSLNSPETGELAQMEQAISETACQSRPTVALRPLRLCCVCRISLDWSHHPPRPLTANELALASPAGHICSQCEWRMITDKQEPASGDPAAVLDSIRAVLSHNGRAQDAEGVRDLHRDEAPALLAIATAHWNNTPRQGAAILSCIENGTLVPFGIWPAGQQPPPRDEE